MKDKYKITKLTKSLTEKGSNCFEIEAIRKADGTVVNCTYFGNTVPKRLIDIVEKKSKDGNKTYMLAVIQPHTSRDKETGRFISCYRTY